MDILSRDDLKNLSEKRDGWHVSIFMPTHRAGPETQQDPIRLKNLLGQAEEQLVAAGLRPPEAQARLEPASKLVQDGLFWQRQMAWRSLSPATSSVTTACPFTSRSWPSSLSASTSSRYYRCSVAMDDSTYWLSARAKRDYFRAPATA